MMVRGLAVLGGRSGFLRLVSLLSRIRHIGEVVNPISSNNLTAPRS